jgi:putative ATPase
LLLPDPPTNQNLNINQNPNLFTDLQPKQQAPLAFQLRPKNLSQFIGQEHLCGKTGPLRRIIENKQSASLIFWGPAGCGKTTLAELIAKETDAYFLTINAVSGSIKDIRDALILAKNQTQTILFIDEMHRFNKSQQDALLPAVESGLIRLIGATTENPYFYINSGLISRCQIYELQALSPEELVSLIQQSLKTINKTQNFQDDLIQTIALQANGDARKCLNLLEQILTHFPNETQYTHEQFNSISTKKDHPRHANDHYDMTSAFIKSLRGSDPDAALYWMLSLLEQGESVEFIVRRMIIFASEDIGNADPQAFVVATALLQAARFVGEPEIHINLSHVVCYLALAPKSNRSYLALKKAKKYLSETPNERVPNHLKDNHYAGAKKNGVGKDYKYPHDYDYGLVKQKYWSESAKFYEPSTIGFEKKLNDRLTYILKEVKNEPK